MREQNREGEKGMTFLLPSLSQITWHTVTTIQGDNVGEGEGGTVKGQASQKPCLQPPRQSDSIVQNHPKEDKTSNLCFFLNECPVRLSQFVLPLFSTHSHHTSLHTLLVSCVSIMKLCTCFSALVSSSFLATTATTSAVQPAP